MEFEFDTGYESNVKIKVIGVGGGGNNAVKRMVETNIRGVEFIAINTDTQALNISSVPQKLVIGKNTTGGKGAGANPAIGKESAEESREEIKAMLEGADMVFITAGMGGGTGTGAAPVVASIAKELGILTVAIVTKPFHFEARRRMMQAEAGIDELSKVVDSIIVIPNERLKQIEAPRLSANAAFEIADDVLRKGVQSVAEVINCPGFINLDFADVTAVMKDAGYAHMGVGSAKGEDKARLAATMAISSPLLSTSIAGATGVLISITYSPDTTIDDIDEASMMIHDEAHPDANIIWGASSDETLEDEIRITIIATGFNNQNELIESTKRSSVGSSVTASADAGYKPADSVGFGASMTAEECAARYFGNMANNTDSANSDVEAPVADTAHVVDTIPEVAADTDRYEKDTVVITDTAAFDTVKVENTEKPAASANAQASYQEYDELFKCIKRIKKN